MNLNFLKDLENNNKDGKNNDFINQISDYLDGVKEKLNSKSINQNKNNHSTINEIGKMCNLTSESERKLIEKHNEILEDYVKNQNNENDLYCVDYKNESQNIYIISKYSKNSIDDKLYISAESLPKDIKEDMILKKENGEFVIDKNATKEIMDKVMESANEILIEQNAKLDNLRKEGALYQVVEGKVDYIYLQNTDTNEVFEEVKFSDEMREKIATDFVLKYENGNYVIDEELTEKFFNSMVGIKEYCEIQEDFFKNSKIKEIESDAKFKVLSIEEEKNCTTLYYGDDKSNTIDVPNELLPFFINDKKVFYYDYEDKEFVVI